MDQCRICNQKFNVGFTPASGPICIQCANIAGNMRAEDRWLLEDFKSRFASQDAKSESAGALASRLLRSMLIAIFVPILAIVVLILAPVGLSGAPGEIAIGIVLFIYVFEAALSLRWLSVINDALVATNDPNVSFRVVMSFFVPIYGIVLTFHLRSRLFEKGNSTLWYGRLQIA